MLNLLSSFFVHARTILSYMYVCSQYHNALVVRTGCAITYAEWTINA